MLELEHPKIEIHSQQGNRARARFSHSKTIALLCISIQRAPWLHSVDLNATTNEKSLTLTSIVVFFISPGKSDYSASIQLCNVNNPEVLLAISKRVNSLAFLKLKDKIEIA